jgi:integrase
MPRPSAPWFRKAKNAWYCTLDGRKDSLGVRGEENRKQAVSAWHRLMGGLPPETPQKPPQTHETPQADPRPEQKPASVQSVLMAFLADAEERVSPECLRNYKKHLLPFAARYGSRDAERLTASEAEAYARKPEWSASYRNGMLGSLVSALRWAERERLTPRNPLQGIRKPPKASRGAGALVSADAHARLCEHAEPLFRAFLQLLWLTGARPGEIASLTAEVVDLTQGVAVLTEHKTAHLGKVRVLFLSAEAVAVLRERIAHRPAGLLFPGEDEQRLTAQAVGCRLRRLCVKAGGR